jgi:hypothetical protein
MRELNYCTVTVLVITVVEVNVVVLVPHPISNPLSLFIHGN